LIIFVELLFNGHIYYLFKQSRSYLYNESESKNKKREKAEEKTQTVSLLLPGIYLLLALQMRVLHVPGMHV